ncbi:MAG: hypothetical protein SFT81_06040 [Candidatus Caenarcaniphilales bacterium]|nr:hypothetical protein [Candidatus Caenarcaniphilales bacterium]
MFPIFLFLALFANWAMPICADDDKASLSIQHLIKEALEVGLSDEQSREIQTVIVLSNPEIRKRQQKAITSMRAYLDYAVESKYNQDDINRQYEITMQDYRDLRDYQLQTWLKVRAYLTSEQLDKLKNKKAAPKAKPTSQPLQKKTITPTPKQTSSPTPKVSTPKPLSTATKSPSQAPSSTPKQSNTPIKKATPTISVTPKSKPTSSVSVTPKSKPTTIPKSN